MARGKIFENLNNLAISVAATILSLTSELISFYLEFSDSEEPSMDSETIIKTILAIIFIGIPLLQIFIQLLQLFTEVPSSKILLITCTVLAGIIFAILFLFGFDLRPKPIPGVMKWFTGIYLVISFIILFSSFSRLKSMVKKRLKYGRRGEKEVSSSYHTSYTNSNYTSRGFTRTSTTYKRIITNVDESMKNQASLLFSSFYNIPLIAFIILFSLFINPHICWLIIVLPVVGVVWGFANESEKPDYIEEIARGMNTDLISEDEQVRNESNKRYVYSSSDSQYYYSTGITELDEKPKLIIYKANSRVGVFPFEMKNIEDKKVSAFYISNKVYIYTFSDGKIGLFIMKGNQPEFIEACSDVNEAIDNAVKHFIANKY